MTEPRSLIETYDDCLRLWKSCRFKNRGKPLGGTYRLKREADVFSLWRYNEEVARISPDNILTFVLSSSRRVGKQVNLREIIPFLTYRVASERYRIGHWIEANNHYPVGHIKGNPAKDWALRWKYTKSFAPEYFPGIMFNMLTGACVNRRVDKLKNINVEKRTEWLRLTKAFRRTVKSAIKLGAMDQAANAFYDWQGDNHNKLLDAMVTGISENKLSDAFIEGLGRECRRYRSATYVMTRENIWAAFDNYYNSVSITLRKRFGVFND